MTGETITQIVQEIVSEDEFWYVDTYDSGIEVGIGYREHVSEFVEELEERGIEYRCSGPNTVQVHR